MPVQRAIGGLVGSISFVNFATPGFAWVVRASCPRWQLSIRRNETLALQTSINLQMWVAPDHCFEASLNISLFSQKTHDHIRHVPKSAPRVPEEFLSLRLSASEGSASKHYLSHSVEMNRS